MKKIIYLSLIGVVLLSCKKSNNDHDPDPGPEPDLEDLHINFYRPTLAAEEIAVPQLTIKNAETQITAIGNNYNGVQGSINKVYISDSESESEWVLLLDENTKPKFLYGIDSSTEEKLPFLYAFENTGLSSYILRFYEYDWTNRLGTLSYEVNVNGDDLDVVFDNQTASGTSSVSAGHNRTSSGSTKITRAFPVPILELERLSAKPKSLSKLSGVPDRISAGDETMDEQFDRQVGDLMDLLQETKTKLINAPCNVSKLLNKSDKNFVCKLSDQLNRITDEEIFNDLSTASENNNIEDDSDYESSGFKLNLESFDISEIRDDLSRHFNDIRNALPENFDFGNWFDELVEFNEVESDDLDDLSDKDGVIHIGLSWNTTSDIDLHVTDPNGEKIWYENETSASGGYLDRDDTDGFGPENIYWMNSGPDGTYKIQVHYYDPAEGPATNFTIKIINGLGFQEVFEGTLANQGSLQTVATFVKNGSVISLR